MHKRFPSEQTITELVAFVTAKIKDRETAKDIVQEILIKVCRNIEQLRSDDKIVPWIYRIARNAIADHFRRVQKGAVTETPDNGESDNELNDCVAYCLRVLIHELPDKYRYPLEMTELQEKSQIEMAEALGLSYPNARSRVQRARHLLRTKLEERYIIRTDFYGNIIQCEDRIPCCCRSDC